METARKSDVDYDLVMERMKDPIFGNWDELVVPCMGKIGLDEDGIADWFRMLVPQQAADAVDGKEVKVDRLGQEETGECTVTVNGVRKRIINSVERNNYVELPAVEDYIRSFPAEEQPEVQKDLLSAGQLSVGSIEGQASGQPAGHSIRDMIRWYNESGGEWTVEPFEKKWYAVRDAGGAAHVASIYLSDEDGFYVPAIAEAGAGGTDDPRQLMLEFAPGGSHKLTSVYYMNPGAAPVQIDPKDLTRAIKVMPALVVKDMFRPDTYVPISKTDVTISAGNADSISLDFMDIGDIGDIGDTDGDGEVFDTAITITDMYGYQVRVSDRTHIKKARIKPAIYTGAELQPELVYRGKTLRTGVDYVLEKETVWNKDTQTLEKPAFVKPGDYQVMLYGKGQFTGRAYTTFSIINSEEAAQALIDEAQANLEAAQAAMQKALESGSNMEIKAAYSRLSNAQNALSEAQELLQKLQNAAHQDEQDQISSQIAELEETIQKLNDQLAEVSAIDISNDAVEEIKTAYSRLIDVQNALTEAQELLEKVQNAMSQDEQDQINARITELEETIQKLNDQLAKVSVVDISNYTVTMKTSFPYTGKAIEPTVKVSGLNESCYTVSYSNNKKIGTGKVTITAKGDRYTGTITKTFKIVKAANTLKVKGKIATVKYKKLKNKAQTLKVKKVIKFTKKGQGTKKYMLSSAKKGKKNFKKYFKVNARNSKVTVKKGLKKGTYKVRVKVTAKGNATHKKATKTVTFKVQVK